MCYFPVLRHKKNPYKRFVYTGFPIGAANGTWTHQNKIFAKRQVRKYGLVMRIFGTLFSMNENSFYAENKKSVLQSVLFTLPYIRLDTA